MLLPFNDSRRIQEKVGKIFRQGLPAHQEHFNDLCGLLGQPSPVSADPTGSESFCFRAMRLRGCPPMLVNWPPVKIFRLA
jgi:hypothetical protein